MATTQVDINRLIRSLVFLIGVLLVVAAIIFATLQQNTNKQQELKNQALHDCAAISEVYFETTNEETGQLIQSSVMPAESLYIKCAADKGYVIDTQ